MAGRRKAKPDEWDDKAQREADEFTEKWNEAPKKLWEKKARLLAEDFEHSITDSWGAPSPREKEGGTEEGGDSTEQELDDLFADIEGEQ